MTTSTIVLDEKCVFKSILLVVGVVSECKCFCGWPGRVKGEVEFRYNGGGEAKRGMLPPWRAISTFHCILRRISNAVLRTSDHLI